MNNDTTIGFVNSIQSPAGYEFAMTQFFDEYMALYDLTKSCNDIQKISGEVIDGSSISFQLQFNSEDDVQRMNFILLDKVVCIFGRRFQIIGKQEGLSLIVTFI